MLGILAKLHAVMKMFSPTAFSRSVATIANVRNVEPEAQRLDSLRLDVLSYSQIDYRRLFVPFCGCLGAVGVGLRLDSYELSDNPCRGE